MGYEGDLHRRANRHGHGAQAEAARQRHLRRQLPADHHLVARPVELQARRPLRLLEVRLRGCERILEEGAVEGQLDELTALRYVLEFIAQSFTKRVVQYSR